MREQEATCAEMGMPCAWKGVQNGHFPAPQVGIMGGLEWMARHFTFLDKTQTKWCVGDEWGVCVFEL